MNAEAETSGDLPPASWRLRNATGVPVPSKGLRTSRAYDMNLSSSLKGQEWSTDVQRQKKMDDSPQTDSKFSLPWTLMLFILSTNWMMPLALVRGGLLYSAYRFEC